MHQAEQRILEFLDAAREPQSQQQIRDGVQGETKHIRAALTSLATSKRVEKSGEGKKGKPYYYEFRFDGTHIYINTSKPQSGETLEQGKESEI